MLSKQTKKLLAVTVLLSLVVAALCGWWGASLPLRYVTSTLPDGQMVYGIDRGEDSFRFFHADKAGKLLAEIRQEVQRDGSYYSYGALIRDGADIYVLERRAEIVSDLIQSETVYRCNFEKGRLEPVWSLPVLDASQDSNFAVAVHAGILSCFQSEYTGKQATGRLLQAAAGGSLEPVRSFTYDIGVGFTDFYAAPSGKIVFTTPAGQVYTQEGVKNPQKRYPTTTTNRPLLLFGNDGGERICVEDSSGRFYAIDLASTQGRTLLLDAPALGYAPGTLSALSFAADGVASAALTDGGGLVLFGGEEPVVLTQLSTPPGQLALRAMLGFVATWILAALCALLWSGFLFLTRGKVPIVTKLLAAFLPILLVSLGLMNALVTGFFSKELVDGQYERLFLLTSQQTATLNASYIQEADPATAFDSVYFYEIRAALNVLPGQGAIGLDKGETVQQVYHSNYFWLYQLQGEQLVSLICEQDYVGVPVEARYPAQVAELFYQVAQTAQPIRTGFQDQLGDWTILLTPVKNEAGEVVAVIETGDTRQALDWAVSQGVRQLTGMNLSVMAVLALLLSAVIAVSLHPLGILKTRVQEISEGKLGVRAPEKGNDEVSEITRTFNTMSQNVAFRDKEIRLTSEGYSRFVPAKVFGLLEKSSVIDVRLADQTSVDAMVLNCAVNAFGDIARSLRSKDMFLLINEVLARLVPVVNQTGGLVDRFDRAGLLAIYTERPDQALDAAVTLCQTLRSLPLEAAAEQALHFHVTLSAGPAMIGIVGADERLEAMTISEHTSFTGFLQPLAVSYGASVLITGAAAAQIAEFEGRYHARTIGFVRMEALDRLERLYDVFDGDEETTRRLKEETRESFEKGVALFCSHQYYDARLLFIEVLKKHREDKAAKNYLYLCDTYYRQEGQQEQRVWIETY